MIKLIYAMSVSVTAVVSMMVVGTAHSQIADQKSQEFGEIDDFIPSTDIFKNMGIDRPWPWPGNVSWSCPNEPWHRAIVVGKINLCSRYQGQDHICGVHFIDHWNLQIRFCNTDWDIGGYARFINSHNGYKADTPFILIYNKNVEQLQFYWKDNYTVIHDALETELIKLDIDYVNTKIGMWVTKNFAERGSAIDRGSSISAEQAK